MSGCCHGAAGFAIVDRWGCQSSLREEKREGGHLAPGQPAPPAPPPDRPDHTGDPPGPIDNSMSRAAAAFHKRHFTLQPVSDSISGLASAPSPGRSLSAAVISSLHTLGWWEESGLAWKHLRFLFFQMQPEANAQDGRGVGGGGGGTLGSTRGEEMPSRFGASELKSEHGPRTPARPSPLQPAPARCRHLVFA